MKNCYCHRTLFIYHKNQIIIITVKLENINIAFKLLNVFKTRLKKLLMQYILSFKYNVFINVYSQDR